MQDSPSVWFLPQCTRSWNFPTQTFWCWLMQLHCLKVLRLAASTARVIVSTYSWILDPGVNVKLLERWIWTLLLLIVLLLLNVLLQMMMFSPLFFCIGFRRMLKAGTSKSTPFVCLVTIVLKMQSLVKNKLFGQSFVFWVFLQSHRKICWRFIVQVLYFFHLVSEIGLLALFFWFCKFLGEDDSDGRSMLNLQQNRCCRSGRISFISNEGILVSQT